MPRANFREVQGGGFGFQEGHVRIERSVAKVFQYPPNSTTKEQSDPFTALVWTATKLDREWNDLSGDDNEVEILIRMGNVETCRPGQLKPKDFDNMNVEPEDLGDQVGTEGNCFFMEVDTKLGAGWREMKNSLEAKGFKPEVLARGITTDFEGMLAHFITVEGKPYIARRGAKAGQEVKPTNLVCDRIETYPYDVKKSKGTVKETTGKPPNGAAEEEVNLISDATALFKAFTPKFWDKVKRGDAVKVEDLRKALTQEMMRQKLKAPQQTKLMDWFKDEENLLELAGELVDTNAAFAVEDGKVTFA